MSEIRTSNMEAHFLNFRTIKRSNMQSFTPSFLCGCKQNIRQFNIVQRENKCRTQNHINVTTVPEVYIVTLRSGTEASVHSVLLDICNPNLGKVHVYNATKNIQWPVTNPTKDLSHVYPNSLVPLAKVEPHAPTVQMGNGQLVVQMQLVRNVPKVTFLQIPKVTVDDVRVDKNQTLLVPTAKIVQRDR